MSKTITAEEVKLQTLGSQSLAYLDLKVPKSKRYLFFVDQIKLFGEERSYKISLRTLDVVDLHHGPPLNHPVSNI